MKIHQAILPAFAALLFSCSGEKRTRIPEGVAKPFVESLAEAKELRHYVNEPFPPDTTLLSYHREEGRDGSIARFWILNSSNGFGSLALSTTNRQVVRVPSDASFEVLQIHLKRIDVKIGGKTPPQVLSLHWKGTNTTTGTIYPHAEGEMLLIEKITL